MTRRRGRCAAKNDDKGSLGPRHSHLTVVIETSNATASRSSCLRLFLAFAASRPRGPCSKRPGTTPGVPRRSLCPTTPQPAEAPVHCRAAYPPNTADMSLASSSKNDRLAPSMPRLSPTRTSTSLEAARAPSRSQGCGGRGAARRRNTPMIARLARETRKHSSAEARRRAPRMGPGGRRSAAAGADPVESDSLGVGMSARCASWAFSRRACLHCRAPIGRPERVEWRRRRFDIDAAPLVTERHKSSSWRVCRYLNCPIRVGVLQTQSSSHGHEIAGW